MIERLIAWSARNRFLVFLAVIFCSLWGVYALRGLPLDAIPDLSDVQVIIFTDWPGRSPDLVEDQITYPIITKLVSAPKVKFVRGQSFFGLSFVYVIFADGTDIYWARSRVLEYMQGVAGRLPPGVVPTLGPDATGVGWVYQYALIDRSGRYDLAFLRSLQDWQLRYALAAVPGVAEVAGVGGFVKQYQVTVNPNALLAYHLPLNEVIEAIRRSNNDVGGRAIEASGTEYMVRGRGYIRSVADIENVPLGTNDQGTPILLRDIAKVWIGADMRRGITDYNGEGEAVGGVIVMRYGENALDVINGVKAKIEEIRPALPDGVEIVPVYDRSSLIQRAIATLKEKLIEESIIVSLVCIIFLFHFRSALVAILILPIAILLAFVPMYYMRLTSNIMSLGGIAIAIGAMVDAAIVMIENAHKRLERWEHEGRPGSRAEVIIQAAQEVGKPLFFSLLVITVSFIPVFTLEAQEGRLFKPLAYTKTFAMFFASLLSVTLAPALMLLLIRGRIATETKNPVSRFLIWLYYPVVDTVLRFRKTTVVLALAALVATLPAFLRLGSEFMPPLNEGTILYMPSALPGLSVTPAAQILHIQDKLLRQFPEVQSVFGKIGRVESPTDPAPIMMVETLVELKPESEWRKARQQRWYSRWAPDPLKTLLQPIWPEERTMTFDELVDTMDAKMRFPGMPNVWWMPIQTRTEMLATGFRSVLGLKIFGPDLQVIDQIGKQIEAAIAMVPGTRSVLSERTTGGYFIDFRVRRQEAARYGLRVEDVEEVIETAIGGKEISMTVEGRERYTIQLRYPRELRDDVEALKRVLVPTPMGAQVPMAQLADLSITTGPPSIRDEGGALVGYVFIDVTGRDLVGYVQEAKKMIAQMVQIPKGYYLSWAGQFQYFERAKARLMIVVPLTLAITFVLLFLNFNSVAKTLIVLLSIPFSLVGGIWLLYLLGYHLSVAVWVGIIALAGVAAETGVVMIVYLDEVYERRIREGTMRNLSDLYEAIIEGAVQRVRPKMMTVTAIMAGLLPIMWSHGTGADVMKRIAAPMVGGMVTSTILTLLVIPAIYALWRSRQLQRGAQ
ncbi:MAG: CusA/CzcA family heavy metal efflux RND transporter [Candidatus Methylomirabilota bacterium]|nr:efflux RND transporter permease subunit [candidate division NC10 bacterium]PWB46093.1 MAG: CusA/CzcA family heavy metal efflux RND transporter [candidate division NC10 bacterium]